MKRKLLVFFLPLLCLTSGCFEQTDGGTVAFYASSLPKEPVKKMASTEINGHTFYYYNAYRDDYDNFVLKDSTSYISNYDIIFGLRFASGDARAYQIKEGARETLECTLMQVKEGERYYSIEGYGFQIMINRGLDDSITDVNVGKIKHWC